MCDVVFGIFMLTWFVARHIVYVMVCYSVWADIPLVIDYGCYSGKNGAITGPFPPPDSFWHLIEPFRNPEGVVCWSGGIKWGFLSALLFLQGLTLMWFWMITKVAITVAKGGEADDTRSDDEDAGEEEEEEDMFLDEQNIPQPFEEEVGVEGINLNKTRSSKYRKATSSASGVSLDRKELLGRIGCDKGVEH